MRFRRANFSSFIVALRFALFAIVIAAPLTPSSHAASNTAAAVPVVEVSLALRGSLDGSVEVGEPVFMVVRLDRSSATEKPVEIAQAGKPWTDAVTVELSASSDSKVLARGRVIPSTASPDSTLDAEHALTGVWWFSAADLRGLAAGSYVARAMATTAEASGRSSSAESPRFEFQIVPPSEKRDRVIQRTIALAAAAHLEGATNKAVALLDEFLTRDPDALPVLIARAEIALSTGDVNAAAVCAYRAKELEIRGSTEPSIALHELITNVQLALADPASPGTAVVPAQLPASVLAPVRKPTPEIASPSAGSTAPSTSGK